MMLNTSSPPQKNETCSSAERALKFLHNEYRYKIPPETDIIKTPALFASEHSAQNQEVYYLSPLNMLYKMEEINDENGAGTGKFLLTLCTNLIAAIPTTYPYLLQIL